MFASLVPDSSAKALSRYTEMVDDIIRIQAEKLQQASELTRVRLKEMDLPDSILALEGNFTLPTDLKEDVEAVQISGGPAGLEAELQQLRDLRRVNQELLVQTEELLQKEATEDAQFRSQFGTRWTRPQSSTLTKNLQDRLNRFAANLKQASDSDGRIERSVRDHSALMSILDRRPIESALPTLSRPIMSLDANEDAIVGSLKQSLRQLEILGAQRAGLEDMLKEMKRKDDILPKLMTSTGSYEDLFRKEIAKYDEICEDIAQNIEAQEQVLLQIQAQNEEFSAVFNLEDYKASREKCYKQIQAAIAKYREIKENINEGLKFYVTLQDAITNVKQQCSDFVMTRSIQCREMIEDVQRHMAGLSFQDRKNTGSYNYSAANQTHQTPRSSPQPSVDPQNVPLRPQTPYYRSPEQPTLPGYAHPPPPYAASQQPLPYHPGASYPPAQVQQPPPTSQEYGQPAYPAWQAHTTMLINSENTSRRNTRSAEKDELASESCSNPNEGVFEMGKAKIPEPKAFGGARGAREIEDCTDVSANDAKLWWRTKVKESISGQCSIGTWNNFKKELKAQFILENMAYNARWQYHFRRSGEEDMELGINTNKSTDQGREQSSTKQQGNRPQGSTYAATRKPRPLKCFLCDGPHRATECPTKAALNALKALQENTRGLEEEDRESNDRIAPSDRDASVMRALRFLGALEK
ncbi:hypothetical protein GH714_041152 [Hevea brasiliensis]|uniref:ALIX V-shaped domain-containing protein n=1 Tax=Hevea brasiliensis TaxID=3981 RepID=A0A6A6MXK0_HEVBR|nr:hypothetical protein GH714_041152 [Hevea brasiliensis]